MVRAEQWDELLLWCVDGIGPARLHGLIDHFGSARTAIEAGPDRCAAALRRMHLTEEFRQSWPTAERDRSLSRWLGTCGMTALSMSDAEFPRPLARLGEPDWLFVRGEIRSLNEPLAAVVGSRTVGAEGLQLTRRVVDWCADRGWNTVSGGAQGVDGVVHRQSIERQMATVVVMPSGLQHPVPRSHQILFEDVVENGGCLVSEHPPWRRAKLQLFVRRNRLISGLAAFTVVVRAPHHSGALITADWASKQGRPVYAVPGCPGDPTAAGCLQAIASGAQMLSSARDIPWAGDAGGLSLPVVAAPRGPGRDKVGEPLPARQADVLMALKSGPRSLEELVVLSRGRTSEVIADVTELALLGLIVQQAPGLVALPEEEPKIPRKRGLNPLNTSRESCRNP